MDRSSIITLVKETYTNDSIGQQVPTESTRDVFCNIRSVSGIEWFEGSRNGINPQYKVAMFKYDYEGELIVKYGNERYSVYRTYETRNDTIELYLEKKTGVKVNG